MNGRHSYRMNFLVPWVSRITALAGMVALIGMLPWLAGRDPALALLRARSGEQEATPEALESIRVSLGLSDGPWGVLHHWLAGLVRGDAGLSWVSGHPILPGMLKALGVSLTLMAAALFVALIVAAGLCYPAIRRGLQGRLARTTNSVAIALTALPEYLLATALLLIFAVWWPVLPPFGWRGGTYVILPALAMGIPAGGLLGRLAIDMLVTTFNERWVITWQTADVSSLQIVRGVLRRIVPTLMPQLALVITGLTGGAIAVEKILAIPGLGRATLGAVMAQDMPVVQLGMLMLLALAVTVRIVAELIRHCMLGPALRQQAMPIAPPTHCHSRSPLLWSLMAGAVLIVLCVVGIGRDPWGLDFARLAPPSWTLPLGADASGRDVLARLSHGAIQTMGWALTVVIGCLLIGCVASLMPRLMAGVIDVANAMPSTLAGIVIAALIGPSSVGAVIAVMLVSWAPLATHAIALRQEISARPHMTMLPIIGVGMWRRIICHELPMLMPPLLQHTMLRLPGAALALAGLGFLGLGAQPPSPEWGAMLASGIPYMERAPWGIAAPSLALMALAVLAVSLTLIWRR